MNEKEMNEAIAFYEAFKRNKTHKGVNDAIRQANEDTFQTSVNRNPRTARLYENIANGLARDGERQRALKAERERQKVEAEAAARRERQEKVQNNSGWLKDAVNRKRGK